MTTTAGPDVGRRAGRVTQVVLGLFFLGTALGVLVTPIMSGNRYPELSAVLTALVMTVGTVVVVRRARRSGPRVAVTTARQIRVGVMAAICGSVVAVLIAAVLSYRYSWDAGIIRTTSSITNPPPYLQRYFGLYPNNIPMLGVARTVRAVGRWFGAGYLSSFIALNGVCLLAVLISVYLTTRWLVGHRLGLLAEAIAFVLIGLSPWMIVAYTDIFTMTLLTVAVCLLVAGHRTTTRSRRRLTYGLAFVSLGLSLVFKPMPAVTLVAIAIIGLFEALHHRSRSRTVTGAIGLLVALAVTLATYTGGGQLARHEAGLDQRQLAAVHPATILSYVAGGLVYQAERGGGSFGGYSGSFVRQITGKPTNVMDSISLQVIQQQLRRRGVGGTLMFEWDKQRWTWGDGTFGAYREGQDIFRPVLRPNAVTPYLASWNRVDGRWWPLRTGITTGLWAALVLACGIGLLLVPYRPDTLFLALNAFGIALFILLFQGRARYLLPFVPIVVVLGVTVLGRLAQAGPRRSTDHAIRSSDELSTLHSQGEPA